MIKYTKTVNGEYCTVTKGLQQYVYFSLAGIKTKLGWIAHYDSKYKNWKDVIEKRNLEIWEVDIKPTKRIVI